jgi:hypothetical protein
MDRLFRQPRSEFSTFFKGQASCDQNIRKRFGLCRKSTTGSTPALPTLIPNKFS